MIYTVLGGTQAAENDVHVVGVSSLAAGHNTLVPQLRDELKKLGRVHTSQSFYLLCDIFVYCCFVR